MKLIFKELYIFSPSEKCARKISFVEGINIVTSSKVDGTNRGKSVVMRSLYYTLGAESMFESKFDVRNKVFILNFLVDAQSYYIYRASSLYKVFDDTKNLLFTSTRASDLAKKLQSIIHFSVMLPNRSTNRLEITPPVYNYLPYYLDQDAYEGSKFKSFNNLEQYANFKDYVLFCHFGIYSLSYFELINKRDELVASINSREERLRVLGEVLDDIAKKIGMTSYSMDIDALQRDVLHYKQQYSEIVQALNYSRQRLIDCRNSLYEFQAALKGLSAFERINEKHLKQLRINKCPECGAIMDDVLSLKSRRYNMADDVITVENSIQVSIHKIEDDIAQEEAKYKQLLSRLHAYEESLRINTSEINDIVRYKGMCEVREDVAWEYSSIQQEVGKSRRILDGIQSSIKKYNENKKQINDSYYQLLIDAKNRFGLDEIPDEKFKSVLSNFSASGSDKCIATVIWYLTIIKLRNMFNPNAIRFPIVFDSPNNVENDDEKTNELIGYLLENSRLSPQFIMSGIGFDNDIFKTALAGANIIRLTTPRFQFLQKDQYEMYYPLLSEFCNAGLPTISDHEGEARVTDPIG